MLGFIFLNSRMRFLLLFFKSFFWIPLFTLYQPILAVATLFRRQSPPQLHFSDAPTLLVTTYQRLQRSDDEEICSICLTEFATEDSVCQLPDCAHVFHFNCIEKWLDRNRFTCPLCRCFFNFQNRHYHNNNNNTNLRFLVPDNPSCLYYFLQ